MLDLASIPVANGGICVDEEDLDDVIRKIGYPIVIKPLDGNHGKGASINVENREDAVEGLAYAKKYSHRVIVEKFITGYDFRVLVIDNKLVAAAKRQNPFCKINQLSPKTSLHISKRQRSSHLNRK